MQRPNLGAPDLGERARARASRSPPRSTAAPGAVAGGVEIGSYFAVGSPAASRSSSSTTRARISAAALRENVVARTRPGSTRLVRRAPELARADEEVDEHADEAVRLARPGARGEDEVSRGTRRSPAGVVHAARPHRRRGRSRSAACGTLRSRRTCAHADSSRGRGAMPRGERAERRRARCLSIGRDARRACGVKRGPARLEVLPHLRPDVVRDASRRRRALPARSP